MANAHGWQIFTPAGFWAMWDGTDRAEGVHICADPTMPSSHTPVSVFGSGIVTIHTHGIFRTPPGWNLWVCGPPNMAKDGATALTGVIESDWIIMTFTMNWQLTRPDHWVRWDANEAICHLMPIQRGIMEQWKPEIRLMKDEPDLQRQYATWSASRDAFQVKMKSGPAVAPADGWQKHYFRGLDMDGKEAEGHQTKLRVCPFSTSGQS